MLKIYILDSLVEFVIVALLFKIHVTQTMGSLCGGASFVVFVENWLCVEWTFGIIIIISVGNM